MKTRMLCTFGVALFCITPNVASGFETQMVLLVSASSERISIGSPMVVTVKLVNVSNEDTWIAHPRLNGPELKMTYATDSQMSRRPTYRKLNRVTGKIDEGKTEKGAGPTVFKLAPEVPLVTSFQLTFSPSEFPFPGVWNIEASDKKNRVESKQVHVPFILKPGSIDFIKSIVSNRAVPIQRRRQWARYLEVVCPNVVPPRWPLRIDSSKVRTEKEAVILSYLEAISKTWQAMDPTEQERLLNNRQKYFAAITSDISLR